MLDIEQLIGSQNIEYIEVVSQVKTENIATVNYLKFRGVLRDKGIIPYGEDLDEDFQSLVALSTSREDLLMLRKLK